jgi:L-aminopeptidase/D-esterase-like protein
MAPLAAQRPAPAERARDLGIPLDGTPGPLDAITDVAGVTVGHATLIRGTGRLTPGKGPVRTGVTAVFPRGRDDLSPVFAGWFSLNGNGEMTGTAWIDDYGLLFYPIAITNTNSVGTVRDALIEWGADRLPDALHCCLPVVAETWDGDLNDIFGFHVKKEHVYAALNAAAAGPVAEGNVGGGTGMECFDFKCGIGTSSRMVDVLGVSYTLGVLVQANFGSGRRDDLRIAGVPVGRLVGGKGLTGETAPRPGDDGSIIIVVATDAPLLPFQLKRIARRAALGLARTGSVADNGSGDIFIAFSTADQSLGANDRLLTHRSVPNDELGPLFAATVRATEEAIINAMVAARDMTGDRGHSAKALPHQELIEVMSRSEL